MAGASLPQPYVRFRAAMDHTLPFLRSFEDMHFVFLPGKDEEYATRLKTLFDAMKLENVTVLDYVDDMAASCTGATWQSSNRADSRSPSAYVHIYR